MWGIFIVQLLINAYHEFSEAGVLPTSTEAMAMVGPIVRNNVLFVTAAHGFYFLNYPLAAFIRCGKLLYAIPHPARIPHSRQKAQAHRVGGDHFGRRHRYWPAQRGHQQLPAILLQALGISLATAIFPLQRALQIEPTVALRGE